MRDWRLILLGKRKVTIPGDPPFWVDGPPKPPRQDPVTPSNAVFDACEFSLGLQPYPQEVIGPPWHPPQPPSQELRV